MSTRLAVFLGIVAIGAAMGIVGAAQPAAADLFFGACNASNDFANLTTPHIGGQCTATSPGINIGQTATFQGGTGPVNVTSESFSKTPGVLVQQFLDPLPFGALDQSGIGIAPPNGEADNEINNVTPAAIIGSPSGNYVTLKVTNPNNLFTGTISIDSLQTGEEARVCAEPNANTFGGANCVNTTLNDGVHQEIGLPAAYSAADPFLAVDAVNEPGVVSDVKISDLDVALSVPEPGTMALVLTGMAGLVLARRRRNSV